MNKAIKKQLKTEGKYADENGVYVLIPVKQGKIFSPTAKGYREPRFKNRVRFIPSEKLKKELCL